MLVMKVIKTKKNKESVVKKRLIIWIIFNNFFMITLLNLKTFNI